MLINVDQPRRKSSKPQKLTVDVSKEPRIIVAEDQMINLAVLKGNLGELGLTSKCEFVMNGQDAVEKCCKIIDAEYKFESEWREGTVLPVSLCLFDFQMPKLNGLDAVRKIKTFIKNINNEGGKLQVQEPLFVIQTAYFSNQFKKHSDELNIKSVYEKPLSLARISEIMKSVPT